MKEIMTYVFGTIVGSGLFMAFYRTVLHRHVSFRTARIYLVASLAIAAVIPALNIPVWQTAPTEALLFPVSASGIQDTVPVQPDTNEAINNWFAVVYAIYGLVTLVMISVMLLQAVKIERIKRRAEIHDAAGVRIAVSSEVGAPFSFLSTIYISKDTPPEEFEQIIIHESSHIRHRHSVEKITMGILRAVMWFNPFSWMASRLLNEVHEFEADKDVLLRGCPVEEYLLIIFKQVFGYVPEISAGLGDSLTKKRFEMMTKNSKPDRYSWLRIAGVLPIAAGMLMLFGFTHQSPEITVERSAIEDFNTPPAVSPQNDTVVNATDKMPKFQNGNINDFRRWVMERISYPKEAMENNISGTVNAKFIVEKDGSVSNVEIVRSPAQILSDEVIRVINSSPAWTPGKHEGKAIRVSYVIPIDFKLQGGDKQKQTPVIGTPKADTPTEEATIVSYGMNAKDSMYEVIVSGYGTTSKDKDETTLENTDSSGTMVLPPVINVISDSGETETFTDVFIWHNNAKKELTNEDIAALDQDTIESIAVLKNSSKYPEEIRTAIGDRKVKDVIVITTK